MEKQLHCLYLVEIMKNEPCMQEDIVIEFHYKTHTS
jgi:hypothetical protein